MKTQEIKNQNNFKRSDDFFSKNQLNIYSGLWVFASLNYLADISNNLREFCNEYIGGFVISTINNNSSFFPIPLPEENYSTPI